jgi:hypothetical protein
MNSKAKEEEVSKEQFKKLYFQYATPDSGWTNDYWNHFFEYESGMKYFFAAPETPEATQMFIVTDAVNRRMIFLTEDSAESFFSHE